MHFRDPDVRSEFADRHVLGAIALDVLVLRDVLASGEVVERPAIHRTGETPFHAGAERIDVLSVELVGPGRLLVVLRSHRAEHSRRLVEKRRAAFLQGILDH